MNRLQAFRAHDLSWPEFSDPASEPSEGVFTPSGGEGPCSFFSPLHYEPNYAYPLLVWLHGPGDDENQLKRIMPLVSLRNYVAVGLRGTGATTSAAQRSAFAWSHSPAHVALAEQRVLEAIRAVRVRFHVAEDRIFVAGFDCGGTMAFRVALAEPTRFAGVLSLCGEFPPNGTPLARIVEARRLPIFLACGRDSRKYSMTTVCENLKLFHAAGMQVALRQYPCGHEITSLMLSDMDRWMMEQITGSAMTTDESAPAT